MPPAKGSQYAAMQAGFTGFTLTRSWSDKAAIHFKATR